MAGAAAETEEAAVADLPERIDIVCAVLTDTPFERCKSIIRVLDFGPRRAVVATPTVYKSVFTDDDTGYLADTADEWESARGVGARGRIEFE